MGKIEREEQGCHGRGDFRVSTVTDLDFDLTLTRCQIALITQILSRAEPINFLVAALLCSGARMQAVPYVVGRVQPGCIGLKQGEGRAARESNGVWGGRHVYNTLGLSS